MPYQNLPSYGKRVRPQPLRIVETRGSVRTRAVPPRAAPSYVRRPQTASIQSERRTRQELYARNIQLSAQPKKARWQFKFKRQLVAALALLIVGFTVFHGYTGSHTMAQAIVSASPMESVKKLIDPAAAAAAQATAAKQARMQTYQTAINAVVAANSQEKIAVSTADISSDAASDSLTLGDQGAFTAASTAKLITAITLLHQIDQNHLTLSTKIQGVKARALLQNMVVNSDNDSWQALNDYLTHPLLKSYMAQIGFVEYDPDVNTFLPSDMTLLMKKLYNNQLLNKSSTDLMLSYMQQANKQEYIMANVPAGYTVYHKAGWLDGFMHDVAIISNGPKTMVLTIYTYNSVGQGDSPANQAVFKQITQAAVQAYFN